jgi:2-polyprenyl-3-methyl-5-hydroxy-6-metoxy-1,4-benzoquinol methylase
MRAHYRQVRACRLCGAGRLRPYLDFGAVVLGNNLQTSVEAAHSAQAYPLDVVRCEECSHFQLGHAVDPKLLYATNYTYLSGVGASFVRHFDDYANWAQSRCTLPDRGLVVDIGSNDGTCLKAFQKRGFKVCGVDPASLPAEIANKNGVPTLCTFFDAAAAAEIRTQYGAADFVTSHNVLAHVDDLAAVFRNVKGLLKEGAYFAFEVGYFREVLTSGHFDTIYHEHLDYHHAAPLVRHLSSLGFEVADLSVNAVQGGSIRLLLRNTGKGNISESARKFLEAERDSVLYDDGFLTRWRDNIQDNMGALSNLICARISAGSLVAGYGSPTKIVLLMKAAGIGAREIAYVVEDNPYKVGRFLPGTGVPIKARDELDKSPPALLVLFAWNFADDIIAKLRQERLAGMEIAIPLPRVRSQPL